MWRSFTGGNGEEESQCYSVICKSKHSYNSFYCQRTCFLIEKYASVYGPTKALRKFKKIHPHLKFGESTVRALRAKYKSVLKDLAVLSTVEVLSKRKVGRPLLLVNENDKKVRKKGVTKERWHCKQRSRHYHPKTLTEQSNYEHLKCMDLENIE